VDSDGATQVFAEPVVEIRSYNLKPATRAEFHRVVVKQSVPMLHRSQVDVVPTNPRSIPLREAN